MAESSPGVEDSCVSYTGEGTLSVAAENVCHYSLLCLRACTTSASAIYLSILLPHLQYLVFPIWFLLRIHVPIPNRRSHRKGLSRSWDPRNCCLELWRLTKVAPSTKVPVENNYQLQLQVLLPVPAPIAPRRSIATSSGRMRKSFLAAVE